mmetsp:Transcript_33920/g.67854  ORF Transcript_33920/g.67854 Transcript_33920/m.67854 type:complete len:202 (-) Transcript_33920:32-637(-)
MSITGRPSSPALSASLRRASSSEEAGAITTTASSLSSILGGPDRSNAATLKPSSFAQSRCARAEEPTSGKTIRTLDSPLTARPLQNTRVNGTEFLSVVYVSSPSVVSTSMRNRPQPRCITARDDSSAWTTADSIDDGTPFSGCSSGPILNLAASLARALASASSACFAASWRFHLASSSSMSASCSWLHPSSLAPALESPG